MLLFYFVELSVDLFEIANLEFLQTCSISLASCCGCIAVTYGSGLVAVGSLLSRSSRRGLLGLRNDCVS